jgi:hypothetical protein
MGSGIHATLDLARGTDVNTGFALRELRLTGAGTQDALVTFSDGLNVIAGPSDTGKTFVAQCLSYLLGSGKKPKAIPEAADYDTARLVLVARSNGVEHQLTRRLDGTGTVEHTTGDQPARVLLPKHNPNRADTLPALLLELSGLSGHVVRTHAYGKTRPLAFSDVEPLFVIDEETVISERSPILGGQLKDRLVERRIFRLLLTGEDDASVVALEKPEIARGHRAGRTEVLEELIAGVRNQLQDLNVTGSIEDAESRSAEWARRADAAAAELELARRAATPVELQRREVLERLRHTRSLAEHRRELQTRFTLLHAQYESDQERLALVEQAGGRLEQLTEERCPVCGAASEHQQHDHRRDHVDARAIAESCRAEAAKIEVLIHDLTETISANETELAGLGAQEVEQTQSLAQTELELSTVLHQHVGVAAKALRDSENARTRELRAVDLLRRTGELNELLADAKATTVATRAEGSTEGASAADAEAFASRAERLLRSWHFPDIDRVTWSERDEDIVVSGRDRASFGKGKRAIMRAAFNLALLRVLVDEQRPAPGLVLIDSPLVVYREPDPGEENFPLAVKQHFYEGVARDFADAQVVVFENDEPPTSVRDEAHVTVFTGTAVGRRGFIA